MNQAGLVNPISDGPNCGPFRAITHTTDLIKAYVDFNKGDVSNPTSLGG